MAEKKNTQHDWSDADLRAQLEQVSGRRIRSRRDIDTYVDELTSKATARRSRSQRLKNTLLVTLLALSFAQYYYTEVQLEILSQPSITVFVPVNSGASAKPYLGG